MNHKYNFIQESLMNVALLAVGTATTAAWIHHLATSKTKRVRAILKKYPTPDSFAKGLEKIGNYHGAEKIRTMSQTEYVDFIKKTSKVRWVKSIGCNILAAGVPGLMLIVYYNKIKNAGDADKSLERISNKDL